MAADKELSTATIGMMGLAPTHHQKTVLVDYELPEIAVGFVMGHNMLDEYWDTDAHSSKHRTEDDRLPPDRGAGGNLPRQDISCMVTHPVLEQLHDNFAVAWQGATGWIKSSGEDLLTLRNADEKASRLKIHRECGALVFAQLLRTQAQEKSEATGKEYTDDIERLYLQTVRNATQFIYIENQYFRWPPLAEVILKSAAAQTKGGRDPKEHGSLHLFVVTNVIDEGIGKGTPEYPANACASRTK
ncbi:hypothetical protein PT300_15000 [Enterobacteriaceae bacterium ESL0689]|nr:hypothetical protein [Enterobacteriaceae bacterium ESL0689]